MDTSSVGVLLSLPVLLQLAGATPAEQLRDLGAVLFEALSGHPPAAEAPVLPDYLARWQPLRIGLVDSRLEGAAIFVPSDTTRAIVASVATIPVSLWDTTWPDG